MENETGCMNAKKHALRNGFLSGGDAFAVLALRRAKKVELKFDPTYRLSAGRHP